MHVCVFLCVALSAVFLLSSQNSVWEELGADGISLDDISFLFGPSTSSSSSTVQTAKTGLMLVHILTASFFGAA